MAGVVHEVSSQGELADLYSAHIGLSAILLWAPWHEPSAHLTKVLDALAAEHKSVRFGKANADVCPALAGLLKADQVPFVAFFDPQGKILDSVAGADPPKIVAKVKALSARAFDKSPPKAVATVGVAEAPDLNSKLKALINFSPVMLFMKGSQAEPFCKFSKQAIALMEKHGVEYSTFDILKDEEVRNGLKDYSNWKTYPQLYINGEFIGGVDIMDDMEKDGSLAKAFQSASGPKKEEKTLESRLRSLIDKEPVMLFMKGDPEQPRCGFSREAVKVLKEHSVAFGTFDILGDEEVRAGLKTYSNWPTYPQLYAKGKLIGGIDIIKELVAEGSLREELGLASASASITPP